MDQYFMWHVPAIRYRLCIRKANRINLHERERAINNYIFVAFYLGREYFLLGHEDRSRERLLYTHLSVGLEWRKKYAVLVTVINFFSLTWGFKFFLFIGFFCTP